MGLFGRDGRIVSHTRLNDIFTHSIMFLQSEFFHSTGQQMKNVFTGSVSSSPEEDDESNNSGCSGHNSPINSNFTS